MGRCFRHDLLSFVRNESGPERVTCEVMGMTCTDELKRPRKKSLMPPRPLPPTSSRLWLLSPCDQPDSTVAYSLPSIDTRVAAVLESAASRRGPRKSPMTCAWSPWSVVFIEPVLVGNKSLRHSAVCSGCARSRHVRPPKTYLSPGLSRGTLTTEGTRAWHRFRCGPDARSL